jgi:hypothetical protein
MRTKRKTKGQKIADTMTVEKFMNELSSSFVGKLFEGENGEPDTILLMQKYLDEGRGSSLEQILMSRAIGELIRLRQEMANLTNPATCFKMGVKEELQEQVVALKEELLDTIEGAGLLREKIERLETNPATLYPKGDWREMPQSSMTNGGECLLSIENVMKICREDEQNQLAEMLHLQEEANFNNEQFNKGNVK